MLVAIQIFQKSLCMGIIGRDYFQFNTFCQFLEAVSDFYSSMSMVQKSKYLMISHWFSVLHMYEVDMQSVLMEIFSKGIKRRMTEDSDRSKTVNSLLVNYILNHN